MNETIIRNADLQTLVQQLESEQLLKRDLIVPSHYISMKDGLLVIDSLSKSIFRSDHINTLLQEFQIDSTQSTSLSMRCFETAKQQLSLKLNMPHTFYKMLEEKHVDLLDHNVTTLSKRVKKQWMLRCFAPREDIDNDEDELIGVCRAVLSNKFKVIDHLDVLMTALKAIKESGTNIKIQSCNLSETNMYVNFYCPEVHDDAKDLLQNYRAPDGTKDGGVVTGFTIRNSETGHSKYQIVPRLLVMACKNGLTFSKDALSSVHLGSQMESGYVDWSERTKTKEVELIHSQTEDAVTTFCSQKFLSQKLDQLAEYTEEYDRPVEAIENVSDHLKLNKEERSNLIEHFMKSDTYSAIGVTNALTSSAQLVSSADRQYELEEAAISGLETFKNILN